MRLLPLLLGMFIVLCLCSASASRRPRHRTVSITNPAAGATVSGTITVSARPQGTSWRRSS